MKALIVRNFLLTLLLFISSASLFGQKIEPKKRLLDPDTTITSKIMNRDYQLYISFPRGYSTKDTSKYPVLYVLDGMSEFPVFKSVRESMDIDKELDSVIIVGIGSGLDFISHQVNRAYDYTPSSDTIYDRQLEKDGAKLLNLDTNSVKGIIKTGGAEKFLRGLTTEIIPYIDTYYKTTNDRGISGYSFGGLFTAWCFLNTKGIFNKFGINSPSLWWNSEEILKQAKAMFTQNKTWDVPTTKVFISVGEKEDDAMTSTMEKFSTMIKSKAYKNVSVTSHQFQGETHGAGRAPSLKRTISVLYGKKK